MISFPNAKINIGLQVVAKRPDGYHDLASIFYPVPISDSLEFIERKKSGIDLTIHNVNIPGAHHDNLIVKAYHLLAQNHSLPGIEAHLIKNIPMGAGLGGGSSDGTFALCSLNKQLELGLSQNELANLALELGSDCPFFVLNKPSQVRGRGEHIQIIEPFLEGFYLVVVSPQLHISTAQAFSGIKPNVGKVDLNELPSLPRSKWSEVCENDFEKTVFAVHKELAQIKHFMMSNGAFYASMTGTGSSVYGIFENEPQLELSHELIAAHQVDIVRL